MEISSRDAALSALPRFISNGRSVWKECQQLRLTERGLSCPNIRSPDFLLYIPSLETKAALFLPVRLNSSTILAVKSDAHQSRSAPSASAFSLVTTC